MAEPGQLGVEVLGPAPAAEGDDPLVTDRGDRDQVVAEDLYVEARALLEVDHRGRALAAVLDRNPSGPTFSRAAHSQRNATGSSSTSRSSAVSGSVVSDSTTSRSRKRLPPAR